MSDKSITQEIIAAFIAELIHEGKNIYKEISSEYSALLNTGINHYISEKVSKYKNIRTILKGNTPVDFYSVYYNLNIIQKNNFVRRNIKNEISTKKCQDIFKKTNFITIIGDAGSGKSTLVKHLFMQAIHTNYKIPVMIELRYIRDQKQTLLKYIEGLLIDSKITDNKRIITRMLSKGQFIFFFDGFDEINAENESTLMKDIDFFTSTYTENNFILTTRPNSNGENITGFTNYNIAPLSVQNGDIDRFVDMQLTDESELANKIKASVKVGASEYIQSFLTNPLLLSLYILTYQTNAEIPTKKYIFYRRVINSLYSEHDSKSKLGYVRDKKTKLTQTQFEKILKYFCFISYFEGEFSFDYDYAAAKIEVIKKTVKDSSIDTNSFIYDLKVSVSLWLDDSGVLSFAHRSLQEYFAAIFVSELSEKSKSDAYKKIMSHCEQRTNLSEIKNFVSLCEEMDSINFYKYFFIPLTVEIIKTVSGETQEERIKNYILYFCQGTRIRPVNKSEEKVRATENKKQRRFECMPIVNQNVYKSIYIHINHTLELHSTLMDSFSRVLNTRPSILLGKTQKIINFDESPEILNLAVKDIIENNKNDIADNFILFLNEEKTKKRKIISRSQKIDADIMNLI
jgi:hypothetical protein